MPDYNKPQPQREDKSRSQRDRDQSRGDGGSRKSGGGLGNGQPTSQTPSGGNKPEHMSSGAGGGGSGGRGSGGGGPRQDRGRGGGGHNQQDRGRRDDSRQSGGHGKVDDEIEIIEATNKKFTGRCRLFIGNLPLDVKEAEVKKLFEEYGELSEFFLSQKGFGFIRLDTRAHAEAAKEALDGKILGTRALRIRFAVHGAAVRVKELSPYVSNELLYKAFSQFGGVERAIHVVDEKGRPTGEGIVEFERKPGALDALRRCGEGVFLMTSNPKPIIVEPLDPKDEDDGQPERMIPKNNQMMRELEQPPRFGLPGTFEHEFGNRWKELFQMEKARREQLEQELREGRERLEQDMDVAFQDYQAVLIREDLRRRQEELDRLEAAKRDRMELIRKRDEERAARGFGGPQGFHGGYQGAFNQPPGMMMHMDHHMDHRRHQEQPQPFRNDFEVHQQQQKERFQQQHQQQQDRDPGLRFQQQQERERDLAARQQQERERDLAASNGPEVAAVGGAEPGRGNGPGDDNLVHGVQKLLQMFKSGGGGPPDAQQLGQMFTGGAPPDAQQIQLLQQQQQALMPDIFGNQPPQPDLFQQMNQEQPPPRRLMEEEFGHQQKRRRF